LRLGQRRLLLGPRLPLGQWSLERLAPPGRLWCAGLRALLEQRLDWARHAHTPR